MVGRGGHRIALIFAPFRMPHFKLGLQRALLSFVPFAAACIPEEEEFIQNRLTGNCPLTFCNLVGIGITTVLTYFVNVESDVGVN